MKEEQRGLSLIGLIVGLVVFAFIALFAMRVVPPYIEYGSAKKAIVAIAAEHPASAQDVRRAFEARSAIDDINVVKPSDLDISRHGDSVVISFAYRKEIPLFANVGLYVDFAATAGQ